jgi:hypothetical protein
MTGTTWGFFYGGLINPDVMERVGLRAMNQRRAFLPGHAIEIAPLVNLRPSPADTAFGLLMEVRHEDLQHVYGQLKATYLPYPVLAHDFEGALVPALCYIVPEMPAGLAEADHINPLLRTATDLGFPGWYLDRIRSFLPEARA